MRRFIISTVHLITLLTKQKKTEISSTGKMIHLCTRLAEKRDDKRPRETVWPNWKNYINLILKTNYVSVCGVNPTSKEQDAVAGSCTDANQYASLNGKRIY
jgi:hypothetical protein